MAGEVSRIFMGVQIQCAQCHDHKTDSWKRRQFHEFAAFFAGTKQTLVQKGEKGTQPVFAVIPQGPRRYTMPELDNPAKQIPIAPRFFLASSKSSPAPALPQGLAVKQRREMAASYITGQDNPWFAKAYINRIWYVLLGEAFYEPIDDIGPERTAQAAEVLEPLAEQWQKGGYDVRWLFRTILNSEAYQRRVRSTFNAAGKTPFASSCPSRYRADQLFDALVSALAVQLDADGNLVRAQKKGPGGGPVSPAQLARALLKNGSSPPPLSKAGARKSAEAAGLASQTGKKPAAAMRAGGLRRPFDRLFTVDPSVGQRRRDGNHPAGSVPDEQPAREQSYPGSPGNGPGRDLERGPQRPCRAHRALPARAVAAAHTQEVEICGRYVSAVGNPAEAFEDIYWSLINSTEFLTRR